MDMTTGHGQELEDSIRDTSELVDYVLVTVTIFTAVVVLFGNILTITAIVTIPEMNHQANFYIPVDSMNNNYFPPFCCLGFGGVSATTVLVSHKF